MQRLKNNGIYRILPVFLFMMGVSMFTNSQQILKIPFLGKDIQLEKHRDYYNFKINNKYYLITGNNKDSFLVCYVFQKNRLKLFGRLKVVKQNEIFVGLRQGYWRNYSSIDKYDKTYFYNDMLVADEKDIPIDQTIEEKNLQKNN